MAKPAARQVVKADPHDAILEQMEANAAAEDEQPKEAPKAARPKRGARAGLHEGEIRVTCVLTEGQSQVLHDWAKTTGRSFREVCQAMARAYIEGTIEPAAADGRKVERGEAAPPAEYKHLYGRRSVDKYADLF